LKVENRLIVIERQIMILIFRYNVL